MNYPPLRDYALIGDSRTAALVSRDGSVDWCCWPRFDSPAILCRLLDARRGGYFRLSANSGEVDRWDYLGDAPALFRDCDGPQGRARFLDFMPESGERGILRCVEGLSGKVEATLELRLTPDFARGDTEVVVDGRHARLRWAHGSVALSAPGRLSVGDGGLLRARFSVTEGERAWTMLRFEAHPAGGAEDCEAALQQTLATWRRWMQRLDCRPPAGAMARRSAMVLKLLTHGDLGGIVAAPTTSLPEEPGGVRNWDYRFTWLRDAAWSMVALMKLGQHDEAMAFWRWLEDLDLEDVRTLYRLDGEPGPHEEELLHLDGYRGSRPVRVGNAAARQVQHDVYGEVIDAIFLCSEAMPEMRPLPARLWRLVRGLAERAADRWHEPGSGMWEMRRAPARFVSSLGMCWQALDRACAMARRDGLEAPLSRWEAERAAIRQAVLTRGYHPSLRSFTQTLDSDVLDASVLLLPLIGLVPPDDPRVEGTLAALEGRLSRNGLLLRYGAEDGLPDCEGAFTACTLWLAQCHALRGARERAAALVERVARCAAATGLLSEMIEPASGDLLGNFPQALTHLELIRAAVLLSGNP